VRKSIEHQSIINLSPVDHIFRPGFLPSWTRLNEGLLPSSTNPFKGRRNFFVFSETGQLTEQPSVNFMCSSAKLLQSESVDKYRKKNPFFTKKKKLVLLCLQLATHNNNCYESSKSSNKCYFYSYKQK
jgi:hypothetical protein